MMALRFVLLGLVAIMGFELPSSGDVSSWAKSGRDWFDARIAEVGQLRGEAARAFSDAPEGVKAEESAPAPVDELASFRKDLAFEVAVETMARDFTADLASMDVTRPKVEVLADEVPAQVDSEVVSTPDSVEEPVVAPTTRVAKISSAVRLTREALDAWASLIRPEAAPVVAEGPVDTF